MYIPSPVCKIGHCTVNVLNREGKKKEVFSSNVKFVQNRPSNKEINMYMVNNCIRLLFVSLPPEHIPTILTHTHTYLKTKKRAEKTSTYTYNKEKKRHSSPPPPTYSSRSYLITFRYFLSIGRSGANEREKKKKRKKSPNDTSKLEI
jgi:hypothetical protein